MKTLSKKMALTAIIIACSNNAGAVDIVSDPGHTAATAEGWAAQAVSWGSQLAEMANQLEQLQQTYNSLNGSRGFSDVLNGEIEQQARRMLPQDAQTLLNLANGGAYGNLANAINSIKENTSTLTADDFGSQLAANRWTADLNRAASNKALSQQAYDTAQQRLSNLENLLAQISATDDPKAIAELQARIQAEQGMIQNEQTKINAMAMLVNAEQRISDMQARDVSIRTAGTNRTMPRVQIEP